MCSPGAAAGAAQGGGLAYSTVGSYFAAQSQKTALKGQAALDNINARLAEDQAEGALRQGDAEVQSSQLQTASLKAKQQTDLAANGVDLSGGGSVTNIEDTTDTMGQIDANNIAGNALRAAFGYRQQAVNATNAGIMANAQAKGISPFMAAGSTFLTGASSIASSYAAARKANPGNSGGGSGGKQTASTSGITQGASSSTSWWATA